MRGGIVRSWRWNKTAAASSSERYLSEAVNWDDAPYVEQSFRAAIFCRPRCLFVDTRKGRPNGCGEMFPMLDGA